MAEDTRINEQAKPEITIPTQNVFSRYDDFPPPTNEVIAIQTLYLS